jgi:predicted AlkP superfamily pyrophosphatase or phosphodiesterase
VACAGAQEAPRTLVLPEAREGEPRGLVVVSLAGLTARHYRGEAPWMPTLAALAAAGVSADAVRGVAPASHYPAHATLSTGRRPAGHGVVADRRLGERGVGETPYADAKILRAPALWQRAAQSGLRVAALAWPSTRGAEGILNLADGEPSAGKSWLDSLRGASSPEAIELARAAGGDAPAAQPPGAGRDAVLLEVACRLFAAPAPPRLLLLHLSQTAQPLAARGPEAPETRAAFAAADQGLARLLGCAQASGQLAETAFAVLGDHGALALHTLVAPNAVLARRGLLTPQALGREVVSWSAIARSNGGSAFVYAKRSEDARLARRALEEEAGRSGAFRVVSAQEMLQLGADPDAWFGLEAEPGFAFSDDPREPLLRPAAARGSGGYLPERPEMDAGFVGFGPGLARGVRIPLMRQTDVAPTLAPLLGLALEGAEGRVLVGVLRLPRVSAAPLALPAP